jgi:protein involved in polysaccharide export with SLBB domain
MINPNKQRSCSIILILLTIAAITFQGCMRFTPSRASLVSNEGQRARLSDKENKETDQTDKKKSKVQYLGREAFFSLEEKHRERLGELSKSRSSSIKSNITATYKIGVGDVLELFVFETDELNRKIRVRPDGNISLPLLGQLKAVGLTEEELQDEITKKLDNFMHSPQVQLFIDQYAAHKVWVVGEVAKPGAYPLSRDNYSLIELISEAGGRTERASGTIVLIPDREVVFKKISKHMEKENSSENEIKPDEYSKSTLNDQEKTLETNDDSLIELERMQNIVLENTEQIVQAKNGIEIEFDDLVGSVDELPLTVPLKAGDTVVIPEAGKIQIEGEVKSPGSFPLSSRTTLSGAIAAAGGFSYPADATIVEVIRELGSGEKAMIVLDMNKINAQEEKDVRLRDGDLVRVPSARVRFAINQVTSIFSTLLGRLFAPLQPGM